MTTLEITQTVPLTKLENGTLRITGTRIPLETVIYHHQQGEPPEEIRAAYPTLELADIRAVISYYLSHRVEVEEYIAQQKIKADEIRRMIEASPFHKDTTGLRERLKARWDAMQQAKNNGHQD